MTEALLRWFAAHRRDLPWRHQRTPYRVWVSEVMLQQTQVATAIPYYRRWMQRFPTLSHLASATLDEVYKLWEGLGYYRRARYLHQAAQEVVARYGGKLPSRADALRALPGFGSYTAAAVASIAFGEPVLAIDGNVKRVAARYFKLAQPSEAEVHKRLSPYLPNHEPGSFNEALMELGATVCRPRAPRCNACPLAATCGAQRAGQVADYPRPNLRRAVPTLTRYALLYGEAGQVWLSRRPQGELLGGLWGFPLGDSCPPGTVLKPVRHAYTHFRLVVLPVVVNAAPPGQPVPLGEIERLALSRLDYKLLERWRYAAGYDA